MAKPIRITPELKQQCIEDFTKEIDRAHMTGRGFEYKKSFEYEGKREATVHYTAKAWYKTIMLVDNQSKEIGWHGICKRDPNDNTVFIIEDIIVYPQVVTGSTITPDPKKYNDWMEGLDDDTYNNMRYHGHSHVNMGVMPSSTDMMFRSDRIAQLRDDDFYVFNIFNKSGSISSEVYDYKNNILYDSEEVQTTVECDNMDVWDTYKTIGRILLSTSIASLQPAINMFVESGLSDFLDDTKELVSEEKPAVKAETNWFYNGNKSGGYGNTYKTCKKNGASNGTKIKKYDKAAIEDPFGYTDERGRFHSCDKENDDDTYDDTQLSYYGYYDYYY